MESPEKKEDTAENRERKLTKKSSKMKDVYASSFEHF